MKPQTFYLNESSPATVLENLIKSIEGGLDSGVVVTVDPRAKREKVANALAHVWKAQVAKHDGITNDQQWGKWKEWLLHIKLADEGLHDEAVLEQTLVRSMLPLTPDLEYFQGLESQERYNKLLDVYVRSSNVGVPVFAEWLSEIQRREGERGLVLESKNPMLEKLMAEEANRRAA